MKAKLWILTGLCCSVGVMAWGDKQATLGGQEGFVERMGGGVREQGLGNVGVADLQAQPGAYWNPALVASSRQTDVVMGGEQRALGRPGLTFGIQKGFGSRMGVGVALLGRGVTDFMVVNDEDVDLGYANPYWYMLYISLGWRATRQDLIGLSFARAGENLGISSYFPSENLKDDGQSPTSYNFGWHHIWNTKWSSGVVVRNLGFNSDLSARWVRSSNATGNLSSETFRPKTLEVGTMYHSRLFGRDLSMQIEVLDYQLADTLLVFDPDWHYWTARMGAEYELIPSGHVRAGYNSGDLSLGMGYVFNLLWGAKPWPLSVDWALVYENSAGLWNPLSVGVRTRIP